MKTFSAKAPEVKRQWWVIDAKNQYLGHVAVQAANLLRGKHKAIFTPHVDTGDFVVVINAAEVQIGGKKETQKSYMSFSGFVGGHKSETFRQRRERREVDRRAPLVEGRDEHGEGAAEGLLHGRGPGHAETDEQHSS